MSTAMVNIPLNEASGSMKIHLHDLPGQPVLLSVKALRALGAVIDFGSDEAIFKAICPYKVAKLETAESGHQLFPLAQDVLIGAKTRATPFSSLHEARPRDGGE